MKKSLFIISGALFLSSLFASSVFAAGTDSNCQVIYGGGEVCTSPTPVSGTISTSVPQFTINEFVKNPQTQEYVDNLSQNDPKYRIGDVVFLKLTATNNASTPLTGIVIKDTLPSSMDFAGGPVNYDQTKRTITITIDKLNSNEPRDFYMQVIVNQSTSFPAGQSVVCLSNSSSMTAVNKTSTDKVQFCVTKTGFNSANVGSVAPTVAPTVEPTVAPTNAPATTKGGLPVYPPTNATTTPSTGPEEWSLVGLIPTALSGFFLRRKTK